MKYILRLKRRAEQFFRLVFCFTISGPCHSAFLCPSALEMHPTYKALYRHKDSKKQRRILDFKLRRNQRKASKYFLGEWDL